MNEQQFRVARKRLALAVPGERGILQPCNECGKHARMQSGEQSWCDACKPRHIETGRYGPDSDRA